MLTAMTLSFAMQLAGCLPASGDVIRAGEGEYLVKGLARIASGGGKGDNGLAGDVFGRSRGAGRRQPGSQPGAGALERKGGFVVVAATAPTLLEEKIAHVGYAEYAALRALLDFRPQRGDVDTSQPAHARLITSCDFLSERRSSSAAQPRGHGGQVRGAVGDQQEVLRGDLVGHLFRVIGGDASQGLTQSVLAAGLDLRQDERHLFRVVCEQEENLFAEQGRDGLHAVERLL